MFNIGFGEFLVIAVLGLLVLGPDRLPDAVRRGSALLRQLRRMAGDARQQVADAAGMDGQEAASVVADLRDLHPRRLASTVLEPAPEPKAPQSTQRSTGVDPDIT